MTPNPYTAAIEDTQSEIQRLHALLAVLIAQQQAWSAKQPAVVIAQPSAPARTKARIQPALNPGPTWPDAVGEILSDGRKLTVAQIVDELVAKGRVFGPGSKADGVVRSALKRGRGRYRLRFEGTPQRWFSQRAQSNE